MKSPVLSAGVARGPWLPKWLSFLSGLPETARRRRLLMPIQAFVDDSGGKGHSRHFVMAGLVGHSEDWAVFADEWRACLDEPPGVKVFKMQEAATRKGPFDARRFSEEQRDDKLRSLARIINRHAKFCTYSVIDLDAHAATWAASTDRPRNEPYFWPFHNTIMATCFTLWDAGWREKFEIIFDEHVIFGPRAKRWYPVVRACVEHREPEAYSLMPADPIFKSDDDFLPIQAADLFAWCIRRATDNPAAPKFEWLLDEMRSVTQSEYSQYYDRDRMNSVLEMTQQMLRDGAIPGEIVELYKQLWNDR